MDFNILKNNQGQKVIKSSKRKPQPNVEHHPMIVPLLLFLAMNLSMFFCPARKMSEVGMGGNCQRPGDFMGPEGELAPCPGAIDQRPGLLQEKGKGCRRLWRWVGRGFGDGEKGQSEKHKSHLHEAPLTGGCPNSNFQNVWAQGSFMI